MPFLLKVSWGEPAKCLYNITTASYHRFPIMCEWCMNNVYPNSFWSSSREEMKVTRTKINTSFYSNLLLPRPCVYAEFSVVSPTHHSECLHRNHRPESRTKSQHWTKTWPVTVNSLMHMYTCFVVWGHLLYLVVLSDPPNRSYHTVLSESTGTATPVLFCYALKIFGFKIKDKRDNISDPLFSDIYIWMSWFIKRTFCWWLKVRLKVNST